MAQSPFSLASSWWRFLENHVYYVPEPPIKGRTVPMKVICVGLPRSGTDSLAQALEQLSFDKVYHSWNLIEEPRRCRTWCRLLRRKWQGDEDGNFSELARHDFDSVLGDGMAVVDLPASSFAVELINAYPEAKIILNYREDLDTWYRETDEKLLTGLRSFSWVFFKFWDAESYWLNAMYQYYMVPGVLRFMDSREGNEAAVRARGKWVYREHCDMIRGKVSPERLLEWKVEDGWGPLCKFLEKEAPADPFPHHNAESRAWLEHQEQRTREITQPIIKRISRNLTFATVGGAVLLGWVAYRRFAK